MKKNHEYWYFERRQPYEFKDCLIFYWHVLINLTAIILVLTWNEIY